MTADTIAAWDGFPKSPKMDGWHWLSNNADTFAAFWVADDELSAWMTPIGDDALLPEQIKEWRYLGPCLTPNQVAALLAERNKLNEYYKDALEAVVDLTAERDAARAEALRLREAITAWYSAHSDGADDATLMATTIALEAIAIETLAGEARDEAE